MANNPRNIQPVQMCSSELQSTTATHIVNTTAETTIVAANATKNVDILCLVITNATATAVTVTLKDSLAGNTVGVFNIAASGGMVLSLPAGSPIPQTAVVNSVWTVTLSSGSVTVDIFAMWQLRAN